MDLNYCKLILESQHHSWVPCINICFTNRYKRALPGSYTKYLEVLIVADTTVVNFVGKAKIKSYLLGLMNIVSTVHNLICVLFY